jgi:class 3 adenylate cyclase
MLKWDLSGPDVEAADASPWDGPFASAVRPFDTRSLVQITGGAGLLFLLQGSTAVFTINDSGFIGVVHPDLLQFLSWYFVVIGLAFLAWAAFMPPRLMRRMAPGVVLLAVLATPLIVTAAVTADGPRVGDLAAATYVEAPLFAFFMCRLPWALLSSALALASYAAVLTFQPGWAFPLGRWLFLGSAVAATAGVVGLIASRSDRLAASEKAARSALAELNGELNQRVDEQVGEIERLGQLRRFLSPQVADAVMSTDSDLAAAHRRRIAVLFCDLRGFTAFTNAAEPEEVIGILDEYYRVVGALLHGAEATIGSYAGDGIMAYLGDPVPRNDAAPAMVDVAQRIAAAMTELVANWRRSGYDLHFGIGIGFGFATLGVVGFDGRFDYTPIGGVVNLAARLCGKAGPGQVLIDHATFVTLDGTVPCAGLTGLELKGFMSDTPVYQLS